MLRFIYIIFIIGYCIGAGALRPPLVSDFGKWILSFLMAGTLLPLDTVGYLQKKHLDILVIVLLSFCVFPSAP